MSILNHPFRSVTAKSPAKLIISGEYSVLYGKPALAMAVNRFVETKITWRPRKAIYFDMLSLNYAKSFPFRALHELKQQIQERYTEFLRGERHIRDVFKMPIELMQYSMVRIADKLNVRLMRGMDIRTNSDVPIGCGMGSSAATIMSFLHAFAAFFDIHLNPDDYLQHGRDIENLQHGTSSGLDLYLALHGGCMHYQDGKVKVCNLPELPLQLVHTGKPQVSTGECVLSTAAHFKRSAIANDFATITGMAEQALLDKDLLGLQAAIRENHKLLVNIGVVPEKVQNFINELEAKDCAAKICGAGAVSGEHGGIVLVVGNENIQDIVQRYAYSLIPIKGEANGSRIV